jgi:hypothetical protein
MGGGTYKSPPEHREGFFIKFDGRGLIHQTLKMNRPGLGLDKSSPYNK